MKKTIFYFLYGILSIPVLNLLLIPITLNKLGMLFWVIFLLSLTPCGITAITLSIVSLIKSIKAKNKSYTALSIIGLGLGTLFVIGGILGIMLLYIVLA